MKKRVSKKEKVNKILDIIGTVFPILLILLSQLDILDEKIISLLGIFTCIMLLPESIFFILEQCKKEENIASYWKYKIVIIPLCLFAFIIGFIMQV